MSETPSLFAIEAALADLIAAREEVTEPAEVEAVERALKDYVEAEIRKVDNIRAFWRHCELMEAGHKEEAAKQNAMAAVWSNRKDRLKQACQVVMEEHQLKRLEGRTGTLLLKGNGGKQPLAIDNEQMVPDEFRTYTLKLSGKEWGELKGMIEMLCPDLRPESVIDNTRIRRALEANEGVPGAHLEPRGAHVEVK